MANQGLLKRLNMARIMDAVRRQDDLHRAAVADMLGLDRKSVTNLATELLQDGWLLETGVRHPQRGRPQIVLGLNRERHYHLGIHISETKVVGLLINLYGEIISRREKAYAFASSLNQIGQAAEDVFRSLQDIAGTRLQGTGLTAPGIIDNPTGRMIRSVNIPALDGVPLRRLINRDVHDGIVLEEASRAKALAEKWFGQGRNLNSFACVDLGIGIGAGIITDRRLHTGTNLGEIGHNIIKPGGKICRCGHRGCLEAYISERVICQDIGKCQGGEAQTLADVGPLCPAAEDILAKAGFSLGLGLAPLINILCPPLIVLSGNLTNFESLVFPEMERGLAEAALPWSRRAVSVKASAFAHDTAAALGAAAAAMSDIFEVTTNT